MNQHKPFSKGLSLALCLALLLTLLPVTARAEEDEALPRPLTAATGR